MLIRLHPCLAATSAILAAILMLTIVTVSRNAEAVLRNAEAILILTNLNASTGNALFKGTAGEQRIWACKSAHDAGISAGDSANPYLVGMQFLLCGDFESAIEFQEEALHRCELRGDDHACSLTRVLLGYSFAKDGRERDATEIWLSAMPDSVSFLLLLAHYEVKTGNAFLAERWARWAIELDPLVSVVTEELYPVSGYALLGDALLLQGKTKEAYLAHVASLDATDNPQAYIVAADIALFQLNDFWSAEDVLTTALERWPDHMWIRLKLGDAYMRQNQLNRASHILEFAFNQFRYDPAANLYLGILRYREGRFLESHNLIEYSLQQDPNNITGLVFYGLAQYRLGNLDSAFRTLQTANRLSPDNSWAQNALSIVSDALSSTP